MTEIQFAIPFFTLIGFWLIISAILNMKLKPGGPKYGADLVFLGEPQPENEPPAIHSYLSKRFGSGLPNGAEVVAVVPQWCSAGTAKRAYVVWVVRP